MAIPSVEDYRAKDGTVLEALYALACVRSLDPASRKEVIFALMDDEVLDAAQ